MKKINLIKDPSLGTERIMFNGVVHHLNSYKVNYLELMFNPLNTRVKDKVYSKYPNLKITDEKVFGQEVQQTVFEALKEDHGKQVNKKLIEKLEQGQTEPLIITQNGIIISGNNRFSLIKDVIDENENIRKNFEYVIVAVIEEELSPKEIIEWELSTQRETDLKLNYEEMNLVMRVKELNDEGTPISKMMKIMAINDEKDIYNYINLASLYETFLNYAGVPNKLDLHRDVSVYSYLAGLNSQLNKSSTKAAEKKILPKLYFDVILGSEIPVQSFRDFIGKVVGNNNIELDERLQLLTYTHNKISDKLEPTIESIKSQDYSKESLKERKTLSDDEFYDFYKDVRNKVDETVDFKKNEKKSNFKSVSSSLSKAFTTYEMIIDIYPKAINYGYTDEEKNKLKDLLKQHEEKIKEVIKIVE